MITRIIALILIFLSSIMHSQNSEVGNWLIYFGNQKINKDWNFHNEIQYRSFDLIADNNQLLLRTGIGYNLTENNNNLLLGYGFINTRSYIDADQTLQTDEHRIFQQFITKQNFGRLHLQHRYRVEQRFLPDDFQMRLRYFLALNVPINKKEMEQNAVYLSAYNEIFINAEKPLFDRNRLYGAIGYVINKNFRFELGYMTQSLENSSRNQFQIVLFNTIPFKS